MSYKQLSPQVCLLSYVLQYRSYVRTAHTLSVVSAVFSLGEAAEEGELELSSKLLSSAALTSRERMRRDRELHRLGLNLVERIPKDVLIDLVQVSLLMYSDSMKA